MTALAHYLLSLPLSPTIHMHGYLMCTDRQQAEAAINRMLDAAEQPGFSPIIPLVLMTTLADGADTVREVVGKRDPKAAKLIKKATDYYFSAWISSADDPDDVRLMKLH